MSTGPISENLIKLAVAIALPTVSCFGFYTAGKIEDPGTITIFLITLAYPAILFASIGLIRNMISRERSKPKIIFWLGLIGIPAIFLARLWF